MRKEDTSGIAPVAFISVCPSARPKKTTSEQTSYCPHLEPPSQYILSKCRRDPEDLIQKDVMPLEDKSGSPWLSLWQTVVFSAETKEHPFSGKPVRSKAWWTFLARWIRQHLELKPNVYHCGHCQTSPSFSAILTALEGLEGGKLSSFPAQKKCFGRVWSMGTKPCSLLCRHLERARFP